MKNYQLAFRLVRVVCVIAACVIGAIYAGRRWMVPAPEVRPTAVRVDRWAADYHGQKWLRVKGTLAYDEAVLRAVADERNRTQGNWYALVPLRPVDRRTVDVLRAVAVIGPRSQVEAKQLVQGRRRSGPITVEGVVGEGWDTKGLFGRYPAAPEVVYLAYGAVPVQPVRNSAWLACIGALGVFCTRAWLRGVVGARSARGWGARVEAGRKSALPPGTPPSIAIKHMAMAGERPYF